MAFWYKNSNGMGFVPEDGEAEIIEDWELEDVSPGTYESVSDVVTARWSNYRQCLAGAIQNGAVALKLRGEPLPDDAKVELTGITLKRIDCACADGSDTAFYLDVIVIADLEISTPNHAMIMQLIGCRSGQTLTEAMQSAYDYYTDRCRNTEKRKQWFRIRTREDALRFQDDCIGWYPDPEISVYNRKDNLKGIEREIAPVAEDSHTHDNKATLDAITPELFGELDGLQQFEDSTKHDIQTLNEAVDNLRQGQHTHNNMAVLDATTAPYTTEEQQKLAGISPETYATQDALNEQILLVREAIAPLEHASHNHTNKAVLDKITDAIVTAVQDFGPFEDWTREQIHTLFELVNNFSNTAHTHENKAALDAITQDMVDDLGGLQQFEDSVTQQIQTVRESVEPVVSQAHWHHNLTVLNSITQAKINEWDSISTLKTQLNALSTELTVFKGKCDNNSARIGVNETDIASIQATLVDLQAQIDALKNNGYTVLFECGDDVPEKYGILLGFVVNGGFRTLTNMRSQFPNFCAETNDYALFYDQEDFNWDAQVLTCVEQRIKLTSDSKIQFCYNSGATEDGMLYLINPPGGKIDVPITLYARSEIEYGRAIQLDFQWLQTQKFITTETDCTGIQPGEYYLCWVGRSNNTHPIIRSVKVKEVEA